MPKNQIYHIDEKTWKQTRKDITTGVFGKTLIPSDFLIPNLKVILTRVEPGGEFFLHKDNYHHVFYYLEGTGEGTLDEERYEIRPGTVVEVQAETLHGYKNTGTEDLVLLTMNIPKTEKKKPKKA